MAVVTGLAMLVQVVGLLATGFGIGRLARTRRWVRIGMSVFLLAVAALCAAALMQGVSGFFPGGGSDPWGQPTTPAWVYLGLLGLEVWPLMVIGYVMGRRHGVARGGVGQ